MTLKKIDFFYPFPNATFPTRIVYLTNLDYRKGLINFEDLNSDKSYDPATAFYQVIDQPRC